MALFPDIADDLHLSDSDSDLPPMELDSSKNNSEDFAANSDVSGLALELDLMMTDLELSNSVVEQLVAEKCPENVAAAKAELKDIETLAQKEFEIYVKLMRICSQREISETRAFEEKRSRFAVLHKNIRNRLLRIIPEEKTGINSRKLIKMAKTTIPIFDGKRDEWLPFKRLYEPLIHHNDDFDNFERHQRLRMSLKGEPLTLINNLPLDSENYGAVWEIIKNHYDDPHDRIRRFFDEIHNCPAVNEKGQNLRGLITSFRANVTALQTIFDGMPDVNALDQFSIHAFLTKADNSTRTDWEKESAKRKGHFPSFKEFIDNMEGRCNAIHRAKPACSKSNSPLLRDKRVLATTKLVSCYYCREPGHFIFKCPKFLKLTPQERASTVRRKRLCYRCLKNRCGGRCNFKCATCHGKHNTLIHLNKSSSEINCSKLNIFIDNNCDANLRNNNKSVNSDPAIECTVSESKNRNQEFSIDNFLGWIGSIVSDNMHALLATVRIVVHGKNGEVYARAILDSASQFNLVTNDFIKNLNLIGRRTPYTISGVGNITTQVNAKIKLKIQSRYHNYNSVIDFLVLDEIIDFIPSVPFTIESWNIPSTVNLADENFNLPSGIDMLLGLNVFWKVLGSKFILLGQNLPRLQESKFGWLVTGNVNLNECDVQNTSVFTTLNIESSDEKLSQTLERFWLLDENAERELSVEERDCERFFSETTFRDPNGRYVVRLPFKIPSDDLGLSKPQALNRFYHLERRFLKNVNFKENYVNCIKDYLDQGHMKEICEQPGEECYYIPHHAVFKETSSTTKLRVVFDASMKTTTGVSLNECLMKGPIVQPDLITIVLRFRIHRYVFTADITQMYRQIRVNDCDTRFQRILWRESTNEPIKTYELKTVTFGETPAPFLATRCLKRLAEDEGEKFPAARSALLSDFYVDDVLTGSNSVESVIQLQNDLIEILASAGFKLNKWCSNSSDVLSQIPKERQEVHFNLNGDIHPLIKTLGILWHPEDDCFRPWIREIIPSRPITPRQVLSILASIYDPLGLIGPVLVVAKLFMQYLWKLVPKQTGMDWDKNLNEQEENDWMVFISQLKNLNSLSIPRFLLCIGEPNFIEIHGFADASVRAYGAVLYLRSVNDLGATIRLICSKSRVAPVKKQSLPRLELCAAQLLAELIERVKRIFSHTLKFNGIRLWSDSEIVLYWIHSPAQRWQTYVANRVQKIQDATRDCIWDHVESAVNPADLLSRGVKPDELESSSLWWNGPEWLLGNRPVIGVKFNPRESHQLEIKRPKCLFTGATICNSFLFERYSDYNRLLRVTAWLMRFIWNFHWYGPFIRGPLHVYELDQALVTLIKLAQRESFPNEIKALENNKPFEKRSPLSALSVFLDARGAIRVGGRLQNSELSFEQQHQYVLSHSHPLAKLIMKSEHEEHLHAGPLLLRTVLRRRFWILNVNQGIRNCISRCDVCVRIKGELLTQGMAALPRNRVTSSKPFHKCGVDYAGPFGIVGKGGRHKVVIKAYIAVFVCFATKAIHLELISDLSSESFLAALSRFVSRRGIPLEIHSDNGTTFVGANSTLQNMRQFLKENESIISDFSLKRGCQWHFIPPYSPHFGGLWEAGVKSVKRHLKTVLHNSSLTFEQFSTLLTQIEACLNSRPLYQESCDPNEVNALTPGHFLIGGPITALPQRDFSDVPMNRLKYWERVKKLNQVFWKRWSTEYLNTLQVRNKWRERKDEVKIGDLVIVKEKDLMPTVWPVAQIENVIKGQDGLVRVVSLRTSKGVFKRPITKLILLPKPELFTATQKPDERPREENRRAD